MRTTLTLEPDVAAEIERRRRQTGTSLKREVNELLRLGLRHARAAEDEATSDYRTPAADVGRCLVGSIDDVAEALAVAEGEGFR